MKLSFYLYSNFCISCWSSFPSMFDFFSGEKKEKLPETIYGFEVKRLDSENKHKLSDYEGSVMLIVNVASKCNLAKKSYDRMKKLIEQYKDQDLKILLFPCSQFLNQEFKEGSEIKKYAEQYSKEFIMMDKTNVRGDNIDPLFKYLIKKQGGIIFDGIKWNFTSFLINRKGQAVARYGPGKIPKLDDKYLVDALNNNI